MHCLLCHAPGQVIETVSALAFHISEVHKVQSEAADYLAVLQWQVNTAIDLMASQAENLALLKQMLVKDSTDVSTSRGISP
jgi:hypothetical protein